MSNMTETSAVDISDRYTGGTKIYLESNEDVTVIGSKWFSNLKDWCSFESANGDENDSGGGCMMVLRRVKQAREQGLEAYGIVDRDILLSQPDHADLFWETDDSVFRNALPFGKFIHILGRWEMENYLLHPQALANLIANKHLLPAPPPSEQIARDLKRGEGDLITATLLSTVPVQHGQPTRKDGFGSHASGEQLTQEVGRELASYENVPQQHRDRIEAFSEGEQEPVSRWDKLSRMLDGKRVFHRIHLAVHNLQGADMESERGTLADIVFNLGLVDPEFEDFFARVNG